ncbi:hypothetical protein SDC9_80617 [bioreactor metagenome]|uniref:Uncharacterized protein n=1 Tax=bioreactor metagenome TaxID=1076179 RepID=A0A644YZP6_9ZZZZ
MCARPFDGWLIRFVGQPHDPGGILFAIFLRFHKQGGCHGQPRHSQQRSSDYGKTKRERHRAEHFPFHARQRNNRYKNNQDDDLPENGRVHHFGCPLDGDFIDVVFPFLSVQLVHVIVMVIEIKRYELGNDYPTVNNNPKVERTQAHQVSINPKNIHQGQRKQ